MRLIPQAIPEVKLLVPTVHRDHRGFFTERWRADLPGLPAGWAQDNHARSSKGTLRGLHFQTAQHGQGKLVGVTRGRILDVAVDIRRGSPTFGQHVAAQLDDEQQHQLWVPAGFAHGYLVLSDVADVAYKVDYPYTAHANRGIKWDDPTIGIDWGLAALGLDSPTLSDADTNLPDLANADIDFEYQ